MDAKIFRVRDKFITFARYEKRPIFYCTIVTLRGDIVWRILFR